MDKFKRYEYYKHSNCLDVFIAIEGRVWDYPEGTTLIAYWMTQGIYNFWHCTDLHTVFIKKEEMNNWHKYEPKGEML